MTPEVVPGKNNEIATEMWLKRQALQVVSQLPDDANEALAVLDLARDLVTGFWCSKGTTPKRPRLVG